jgi:hypothetical protein
VSRPEPRPLPAGWRFEPSDVVGAMADLYPEWACWQDNGNNVHACTDGFARLVLDPNGVMHGNHANGKGFLVRLPAGIASPADVARWAVAVATGGNGDASSNRGTGQ